MNKKKRFLMLLLVVSLSISSIGSPVLAASESTSGMQESSVTDSSANLSVKGRDSAGDILASAISEENENLEKRKRSADNITGLEFEDNTAVVEFQTQAEAELIVAVYDEEQLQMLASGKELVSKDENIIKISISEKIPQYFIATAYLLDKESHEPLCDAYTTELYTKNVQDLKNSTVEDYDSDKVVQLDDTKTNFAVLNDNTTVADEKTDNIHLTDNGDDTYTITNADSSITGLAAGDTFSYSYEDGTILLIKVANIWVNGTTVTIQKDTNTELNDYFDYVKIETDSDEGTWSVDNSNLDEGVTPAEPDADTYLENAAGIGASSSTKYSTSYNLDEKFDDNVKVTGSFKYGFSFTLDFYYTSSYQYLSFKHEYSAGISVDITGKLKITKIPLGRIELQPLPCVNVGFTPFFVVEASGKVEYSGELKGTVGGAYDGNIGFKDLSSLPKCKDSIKMEGKIFVGVKATPYVSIISSDLAKASLELSCGAEVAATRTLYDSSKDEIHDCNNCLNGEIKSKLSVEFSVDLVKGLLQKKVTFEPLTIKIGDFYYSLDYNEFGWNTCPRICYPVKISVRDKKGNSISGISTITVTDKKSGEAVELRVKKFSFKDFIELEGGEKKKAYLPNGSYIVHAANGEDMKGEANLTVHDRETEIKITLSGKKESDGSGEIASGKDGNITWRLTGDKTLYIEGQGDIPDYSNQDSPWRNFLIDKVVIRKGITSIGKAAFSNCSSLSSVKIPEGVTRIGWYAFSGCSSLSSIKIPEGVTSIDEGAFSGCSSLSSIKIPEGVTSIEQDTFSDCSSLSSIEIPRGIISIESMAFQNCENLNSIKLPDEVTSIGDRAFEGCSNLITINLPKGITDIESCAFRYCNSLSAINIPEGVTKIEQEAFYGCKNLSSIEIPQSVTCIDNYAFYACKMHSIKLPEKLTSIGYYAFMWCSNLRSIEIPQNVTYIGPGAFEDCSSLENIKLPEKLTSIEYNTFSECSSLSSIELPEKLTSIGSGAFGDCSSLSSIKLPKKLTSIENMTFAGCISLSSIELSEKLVSIGDYIFEDCKNLCSIEIPENVSEVGVRVFDDCDKLVSVYFKGNKPKIINQDEEDDFFSGLYGTTAYYPKNNKTWKGIESESFGGKGIKWVAYDPSSLDLTSVDAELAGDAEIQLSKSLVEELEFSDDVNNSEDDFSTGMDDSEANLAIESGENAEKDLESSASPDRGSVETDEIFENNFSADSGEVTECEIPISNAQNVQVMGSAKMFSNLVPLSRCLFVVVKDENEEYLLEPSNLLYIGQKDVDETGMVSFQYMIKEPFESPIFKIFGGQLKDIKNMTASLEKTKYVYDGTPKKPSVTLKEGTHLLKVGQDYTLTYSNNIKVGTATVKVTGKGDYTGTLSVTFRIVKADNVIRASNIIKNTSNKVQNVKIKASVKGRAKLTYSSNNKYVKVDNNGNITIAKNFIGKAVITIVSAKTAKYNRTAVKITVTVRPIGTVLYSLTNDAKGKLNVVWKKNSSVSGYRIQYSTDKNFKNSVGTVNIGKNTTTAKVLSKLKKGKIYYVRVATYKKSEGDKIYSSWSKVKKIKVTK